MRHKTRHLYTLALIALVAVLAMSGAVNAFYQSLLHENFEQDQGLWPWDTDNIGDQGWMISPGANTQHPYYTWAVEESTIYHYIGPDYYRSIWCCGLPNNYLPGQDDYPPNQLAWVIWGPFDINSLDMFQVGGVFYHWAETEPWYSGAGDAFWMVAKDDPNLQQLDITEWYIGYAHETGVTQPPQQWIPMSFDFFDLVTWEGDSVALMPEDGETLNNVYFGFVFYSDSDDLRGRGVFLDDIDFGYDDGQFDYQVMTPMYYKYADSVLTQAYTIHQNDTIAIKNRFNAHGATPEIAATHVVYINNDVRNPESEWIPLDSMTGQWIAHPNGRINNVYFEEYWVPDDTGYWGVKISLDVDDVQMESDETNNIFVDTIYVDAPQTAPYIIWHDLIGTSENDTLVVVDVGEVDALTIDYTAINSPPSEAAGLSFLYCDNDTSTQDVIMELFGIIIDNERHQVEWHLSELEDSVVYRLYAFMDDGSFLPITDQAPQYIMKVETDDVDDVQASTLPTEFAIESIYPNPFNPTVEVEFAMPQAGDIKIQWYSLEGRLVDVQTIAGAMPGFHKIAWTPQNLASGMYLMRASSPAGELTGKVLYLK